MDFIQSQFVFLRKKLLYLVNTLMLSIPIHIQPDHCIAKTEANGYLFPLTSAYFSARPSMLQHILNKNPIPSAGILHQHVGDGTDQVMVLDDGSAAHTLDDAAGES